MTGWHYQGVSWGNSSPSDPLSCGLALCGVITVLLCGGGWSALQGGWEKRRGGYRGRTGLWVCVCLCMCGTVWGVLLPADLVIHQTGSIHPTYPPHLPHPSTRLSARPGISTLISHLWRPNELRLLVHLWDPTDYQTGGRPFVNGKRWHLRRWPCCQGERIQNGGEKGKERIENKRKAMNSSGAPHCLPSQALPCVKNISTYGSEAGVVLRKCPNVHLSVFCSLV